MLLKPTGSSVLDLTVSDTSLAPTDYDDLNISLDEDDDGDDDVDDLQRRAASSLSDSGDDIPDYLQKMMDIAIDFKKEHESWVDINLFRVDTSGISASYLDYHALHFQDILTISINIEQFNTKYTEIVDMIYNVLGQTVSAVCFDEGEDENEQKGRRRGSNHTCFWFNEPQTTIAKTI